MGFLKRLVKGVGDLQSPRPGGELGGVPARAMVVEKRGYGSPEAGGNTRYVNLDLVLQVIGEEQTTKVRAYVDPRAAVIATAGLEVPVRVDEATGALLGLDGDAWEAEAKVLDAEYEAGTRQRGDRRTAADVLAIDDDDPALAPIGGVGIDTWLEIEVGIVIRPRQARRPGRLRRCPRRARRHLGRDLEGLEPARAQGLPRRQPPRRRAPGRGRRARLTSLSAGRDRALVGVSRWVVPGRDLGAHLVGEPAGGAPARDVPRQPAYGGAGKHRLDAPRAPQRDAQAAATRLSSAGDDPLERQQRQSDHAEKQSDHVEIEAHPPPRTPQQRSPAHPPRLTVGCLDASAHSGRASFG